jgi:hypothetical protein
MRKKSRSSLIVFGALLVLVVGLAILCLRKPVLEGMSCMEDMTNFTGFVVFTKPKGCLLCEPINGPVMKLHAKFPDYVRVVDCTDQQVAVTCMTQFKVKNEDLPVFLQFKNGIDKRYYGLTDFENLEKYLLDELMKTRKTKTLSDKNAAALG